ncbi:hypothetical protein F5Y18DRAFT_422928 [Xylariaceae sp. FL1019]|nr:hypothetical protein F5Y18DRAFT_422928 [Xylariaceae sp. FL1019]
MVPRLSLTDLLKISLSDFGSKVTTAPKAAPSPQIISNRTTVLLSDELKADVENEQSAAHIPDSLNHDCSVHHQAFPSPKDAMNIHAYDARVLEQGISDIVNSADNIRFAQWRYEFVTDFLLSDTSNATYDEAVDILHNWMVRIDQYFFQGSLTQQQQKLLRLRVFDRSWYSVRSYGIHTSSIQSPLAIILLSLTSATSGKRYPKIHLLNTLVHEMVHAWLQTFFNWCPVNDNNTCVTGPQDYAPGIGHGSLWHNIYSAMYLHMRTWHPSLAKLNTTTTAYEVPRMFSDRYFRYVEELPYFSRQWYATHADFLAERDPESRDRMYADNFWGDRFIGGHPQGHDRRGELQRALLRLNYPSYGVFVQQHAPYVQHVFNVTMLLFALLCTIPPIIIYICV